MACPSPLVADRCRIVIDRRFLIEEDLADVKAEVIDLLEQLRRDRPSFDYRIRELMEVLPTMTAPARAGRARGCAGDRARSWQAGRAGGLPWHLRPEARPAHRPAAGLHRLWPGILELAHQPDEYVVIDDLVAAAKVMAAATVTLLGVEA